MHTSNCNRVLAVVVTYQPENSFINSLSALLMQVDEVVVVDNHSTNVSLIETVTSQANCRLIKNCFNFGIAYALNQGRAIALAEDFSWLATFDQDSQVTEGMVPGLLALHQTHPRKDEIGVLVAFHRDRVSGQNNDDPRNEIADMGDWRLLRTTITSGSLISTAALRAVGVFDESLFIDYVDYDFYMRCRQNNLLIVGSKHQVLSHSLGSASHHKLLGVDIICSNHSVLRRYYITRNQLEIYRRYLFFEPLWCITGIWRMLCGSITVLIFEEYRRKKLRAMLKGTLHFLLRKFGSVTVLK